jgi:hypothetical protein
MYEEENKLANFLLSALILISCTMFVWTINHVSTINDTNPPTTISAFNA